MIVPMKKVSLILKGDKKEETLTKLRKLGLVHIEISEGSGEKLVKLGEQITLLESAIFTVSKSKNAEKKDINTGEALSVAKEIASLDDEKKQILAERVTLSSELDRVKSWGDINPESVSELTAKGIDIAFYEMPKAEYKALPDSVTTVKLEAVKSSVKFMLVKSGTEEEEEILAHISVYRFALPQMSSEQMKKRVSELNARIDEIDKKISSYVCYADSLTKAVKVLEGDVEFETYATGMENESLSENDNGAISVAYFKGYIEAENIDKLKQTAAENSWGLLIEEPTEEDNVPTKLKNNKFVSLIYPLTDFLGTVPGYFEYDISGWFLAFILIFFGIIFGDGGYGLLITTVAAIPIIKALISKKTVSPTFLLVGLFGLFG
jgi:V/A-type H+-transporting ATPase subunit I